MGVGRVWEEGRPGVGKGMCSRLIEGAGERGRPGVGGGTRAVAAMGGFGGLDDGAATGGGWSPGFPLSWRAGQEGGGACGLVVSPQEGGWARLTL